MRTSHSNGVLLVFVTLSTNLTIASTTPAQTPEEPIMKRPVSTYSIVARWGAFGLESRTRHLAEMVEGDAFRVPTLAIRRGRKTLTYRHDLFKTEPEPVLCATCDHTIAPTKMSAERQSTPLGMPVVPPV